jgi:hypothetical protein
VSGFRDRAAKVASLTARKAIKLLDRGPEAWLRMPWDSLDAYVAGMSEGDIWFVGGFRSDGKTSWLTSALDCWYESGKRIFYLGMESQPMTLMTHWACKRLRLDAGEILGGNAARLWPDWQARRAELKAMIASLEEGQTAAQVHFSPVQFVDAEALRQAFNDAREFGADVLIVDHIDHIDGERGSSYEQSRQVCSTLMRSAQDTGIRALVATQFNNEACRRRGLRHLPPQPQYVYMGSHKAQIADGMLGLYRPYRPDITAEEIRQYDHTQLDMAAVCAPDTMAVAIMKHRLFGRYEGKVVRLRFDRGRVMEPPIHQDTDWNV